jgi:NADH-quinone oxidoreductase subunit N
MQTEVFPLTLFAITGMLLFPAADDLLAMFVALEVLSLPLYLMCGLARRRRLLSQEASLKYFLLGAFSSAFFLYGTAMLYGYSGTLSLEGIADAIHANSGKASLALIGVGLVLVGLLFKVGAAPFHSWIPDVYQGAPTPITAFMAVATKAAAFGIMIRLFDGALIGASSLWAPAFATLAVVTIVVGNVGAIGQSSVKRMLAYSSVAQAGYILAGLVVSTKLGASAIVFYLFAYTVMNLAAFAVVVARERETPYGDDLKALYGLGADRPWLAWPMTIAMLSLAGFPATAGFFGKIYLIEAAIDNQYAFLSVAIVLGSAISLAYYLRVVAAVWMSAPDEARGSSRVVAPGTARPAIAGGSQEADEVLVVPSTSTGVGWITAVAVVCAIATIAIGIYPEPLLNVANDAGAALQNLL